MNCVTLLTVILMTLTVIKGAQECTFDEIVNPLCGFNLDVGNSDVPWKLKYGPTPQPRTGPPSDHSGTGKYVLAQTSTEGPDGLTPVGRGLRYRMSSPTIFTGNRQLLLRFFYYMWGKHVGVLNGFIVVRGERRSPKPSWRRTGSQEEEWLMGEIRLPLNSTTKVIFEAVSGKGVMGDIAMDDFSLEEYVVDCTFEEEVPPQECNFTQHNEDNFDWQLNSGKTPTRRTGPTTDHTLDNSKGSYMYVEATGPNANDRAALISPVYMKDGQESCNLSFFYHMYGESIGMLKVHVMTSPDNVDYGPTIWQLEGNRGKTWLEGSANLTDVEGRYQIVFQGIRGSGSFGDIAIDDMKLLGAGCLNGEYYQETRHNTSSVDPCASQPCLNGGACNSTADGFVCSCTYDWTGRICQDEAFPTVCSSDPCLHDGQCVLDQMPDNSTSAENGTFHCVCQVGWAGDVCDEVDVTYDRCADNPCANSGTCRTYVDHYTCECTPRWMGLDCEDDVDECNGTNPCESGGTCINTDGEFNCTCPDGFSGDYCEEDCSDGHKNCAFWAGIGECRNNPRYMLVYCRRSCGVCTEYVCTDKNPSCPAWRELNECKRNPFYMLANCHLSCGVCIDDECNSLPCQNGGTCIDGDNSYTCECLSGYVGNKCQVDVDECAITPCLNNGTCVDQINGYTCNCTDDYIGDICETELDECSKEPCLNGGTCTLTDISYNCSCSYGFEGQRCEIDIDECATSPCAHDGVCIDHPGGFVCNCTEAWTGPRCEHDFNECHSNPCQNGGGCYHGIGQALYFCNCLDGWEGTNCEDDIDECASGPCQHEGTCTGFLAGFICTCQPGWEGPTCADEIMECASSPCQNNAFCTEMIGSYICLCQDGFTGLNCEMDVDECASNPCENNSTCIDQRNGHICMCTEEWTGRYCEQEVTTPVPTTTTLPPTPTTTTLPPTPTTTEDWIPDEFSESSYYGSDTTDETPQTTVALTTEQATTIPTTTTASTTTVRPTTIAATTILPPTTTLLTTTLASTTSVATTTLAPTTQTVILTTTPKTTTVATTTWAPTTATTTEATTTATTTRATTTAPTTTRAATTATTTRATTTLTTSTAQPTTTTATTTTTTATTTTPPTTMHRTTTVKEAKPQTSTENNNIPDVKTDPNERKTSQTGGNVIQSQKGKKSGTTTLILATVLGGLLLIVIVCILFVVIMKMRRNAGLGNYEHFTMDEADKPAKESRGWHELKFRSFGDTYSRLDDNGAI